MQPTRRGLPVRVGRGSWRAAPGGAVLVKAEVPQLRVRPSDEMVHAVERICGQGSVVLR